MKATTCTNCPHRLHCLILCGEPRRLHHQFKDCFYEINKIFKYNNSTLAYDVVRNSLSKSRWRAAEPIILKNAYATFYYTKEVLKERWAEGENTILQSQDSYYVYCYAREVIEGRWPEGEKVLLAHRQAQYIYYYIGDIMRFTRWPEAEDIIKTDATLTSKYAVRVLKERWLEAEKIIAEDWSAKMIYNKAFGEIFVL